jgi:hypothetical protein
MGNTAGDRAALNLGCPWSPEVITTRPERLRALGRLVAGAPVLVAAVPRHDTGQHPHGAHERAEDKAD